MDYVNKTELVEQLRERGVVAHRGMTYIELIDLTDYLFFNVPIEPVPDPLAELRTRVNDYLLAYKESIAGQLPLNGDCSKATDTQVVLWALSAGLLEE